MWLYERQNPAVVPMVGAVTATLVKQNETYMLKQRVHLCKADAVGTVLHPLDNFITLCHVVHATFGN